MSTLLERKIDPRPAQPLSYEDMRWSYPIFSRGDVDRAGAIVKEAIRDKKPFDDEIGAAIVVLDNWRAAHSFPLNTLQIGLRRRVAALHQDAIVAQRIKRLPSIVMKLDRFDNMRLSQIQDIGGCRAIVGTVQDVERLAEAYKSKQTNHKLVKCNDYLAKPRISGYRGVHICYRYNSNRNTTFNGLTIEIQLRSQSQHAWATAVETVGAFTKQALKASVGEADWLRFFALMGSAMALREGTSPVGGTPHNSKELRAELRAVSSRVGVVNALETFGRALQIAQNEAAESAYYFLLQLDATGNRTTIWGFGKDELKEATLTYNQMEQEFKDQSGFDIVLVSVESLDKLRRAYPNYFLDTSAFLNAVKAEIE